MPTRRLDEENRRNIGMAGDHPHVTGVPKWNDGRSNEPLKTSRPSMGGIVGKEMPAGLNLPGNSRRTK